MIRLWFDRGNRKAAQEFAEQRTEAYVVAHRKGLAEAARLEVAADRLALAPWKLEIEAARQARGDFKPLW